jgi:hypothetical protein
MISLDSRYAEADISFVLDPKAKTTRVTVFRSAPEDTATYRVHRWSDGDRWDFLAQEYLDAPTDWWRILDANPQIIDPTSMTPGMTVYIP